jgi:APA family basic amino acid/polyamine antiporter
MGPIALAWVVGGLFALTGVLTLAELASMLPRAGGPYVYIRAAYGNLPAFLFGWTEFLIIRSGSVATLAAAFALYASQLLPAPSGMHPLVWQTGLAITAAIVVAVINVMGTRWGGALQVVGTILKVGALVLMMILPFVLGKADVSRWSPAWPSHVDQNLFRAFMVAMVGVLWAYDGWINSSNLAEEIRNPARNIPLTLVCGGLILVAVYVGMNLVYHLVLPMSEIATASTERGSPRAVSADFCQRLLGDRGRIAISLVVMLSTFIALNGNALAGPRAYFALARDGLFPRFLAQVHPVRRTPAAAIIAQTAWSVTLSVAGTLLIVNAPPTSGLPGWVVRAWGMVHEKPLYDVLYTYVIFGGTIFYTLSIASVFILRRTRPELHRPYRTLGYPITPLVYIAAACVLLYSLLRDQPFESLAGLGIILLGVVVYFAVPGSAKRGGLGS